MLPIITTIISSSISLSYAIHIKSCNNNSCFKKDVNEHNIKYISKLIRHVILEQLKNHTYADKLMELMQSAYRCNLHTDAIIVQKLCLLRVQNDIFRSMDNQRVTMILLLDLSAAFDTVSHSILNRRLKDRIGVSISLYE